MMYTSPAPSISPPTPLSPVTDASAKAMTIGIPTTIFIIIGIPTTIFIIIVACVSVSVAGAAIVFYLYRRTKKPESFIRRGTPSIAPVSPTPSTAPSIHNKQKPVLSLFSESSIHPGTSSITPVLPTSFTASSIHCFLTHNWERTNRESQVTFSNVHLSNKYTCS